MDKYTTLRSLVNHWISVSDNIRNFPPVAVETFIAQVLRRKDSDMASAKQAVELIENIDETLISAKSINLFCQLCFQMSLPLTALHFVDRVNGMASLVRFNVVYLHCRNELDIFLFCTIRFLKRVVK